MRAVAAVLAWLVPIVSAPRSLRNITVAWDPTAASSHGSPHLSNGHDAACLVAGVMHALHQRVHSHGTIRRCNRSLPVMKRLPPVFWATHPLCPTHRNLPKTALWPQQWRTMFGRVRPWEEQTALPTAPVGPTAQTPQLQIPERSFIPARAGLHRRPWAVTFSSAFIASRCHRHRSFLINLLTAYLVRIRLPC